MARIRFLENPTFSIETGELLFHDGESYEEPSMLFDRGASTTAGNLGKQAGTVAGNAQTNANELYSSLVPGLIRQAQNPNAAGLTAQQLNNANTAGAEAIGGANATATGEGRLAALRSRTAGGFAPALDEAARARGRQLSTNALDVQNANARLGLERSSQAQQQLEGLYGTNTSNMLKAMGLQDQDLETQLAANRQGWVQNTDATIAALRGAGASGGGGGGGASWAVTA
jgi:hypothetical protein